ncbi:hypothetical protein WJX72_002339 [[Myrmecia] bisecta]|uniref:Uncharacterized protein n=1 Tax=[Myrmecia] bisecta TaxID=41462 RepID=A0AAW1Q1M8_9CHLO
MLKRVTSEFDGHVKTAATATAREYEVGKAIATFLTNGRIVVCNYKCAQVIQSTPGDIDCLVEGIYEGGQLSEEVVVIAEVKKNMVQKHRDARRLYKYGIDWLSCNAAWFLA